jgi:glycerol-3-phosphate dehydrogenase subunit B
MAYDVIVIGAGLAGLIGGLRLAEVGQRVLLLAKGNGATHWASGTIGVAGAGMPRTAVAELAARPEHPYSRAGLDDLMAALDRLRAVCADAGYPLAGSLDQNLLLPSAMGALLPAAYAPETMIAGTAEGSVLIAGFRELRDFFPPLAAANLRAQGIAARGAWLELPPTSRRLDFTPTVLADLFEQADFRAEVARRLRAVQGDAVRIGLPAVLGQRQAAVVAADLARRCEAPVFEIPTLPPSVPGIRLYEILADAFQRTGGRLQIGSRVVRAEADGGQVRRVVTEAAAREPRWAARGYLLATGGLAGGGLRTDYTGAIVETALGLPVRAPASRQDWFADRFLAPEGQPIHLAGIATDSALRPLDAAGQVVYDNVAVAGATLGGADLVREGSYEGVALATGWRAAGMLLAQLADPQAAAPVDQSQLATDD